MHVPIWLFSFVRFIVTLMMTIYCGGNFHIYTEKFDEEFVEGDNKWRPGIDLLIYLSWKTGAILHSELA